jgi:hypothetical protein
MESRRPRQLGHRSAFPALGYSDALSEEMKTIGLQDFESSLRVPAGEPSNHPREVVAERLAGLEWRAVQAEVGWGRMRARRVFRVADVVAGWLRRPWRVLGVFGELHAALQPRTLPVLPDRPSP